jgi:hypothetical protein
MAIGQPAPPRFRSIFLGLLLAAVLLCAFVQLPLLMKLFGAAALFIPDKLGLVDFAYPGDVTTVDFSRSPTGVHVPEPGAYLLYTDNYDLLVINDGTIESAAPPWISVTAESGQSVHVELVTRGLIVFDTPFAAGRPVLRLLVEEAGPLEIDHPRRPTEVHFVPDYITGNIEFLVILTALQIAGFGYPVFTYAHRKVRARRAQVKAFQAQNRARIGALKNERRPAGLSKDAEESPNLWRPRR